MDINLHIKEIMIGKKAFHAVNALVQMAHVPAGESITTAELAQLTHLSVSYTESLLKSLREAGLIGAVRGPGGGYQLAKPAASISIWTVVQVMDARSAPAAPVQSEQIDLQDLLGHAMDAKFQDILSSCFIADCVQADRVLPEVRKPLPSGFQLKPMAPRWMPVAPNSVFQLSQYTGEAAVAW